MNKILLPVLLIASSIVNAVTYTYEIIEYPGAIGTAVYDVNNSGLVVGGYTIATSEGNKSYGFTYDGSKYEQIIIPDANGVSAYGVNNDGVVVGFYRDSVETQHGFIYENGVATTFDKSDTTRTALSDINDNGVLIGYYDNNATCFSDDNGTITNFIEITSTSPNFTPCHGINNSNQIVGVFRPATSPSSNRGYLLENNVFTTVPDDAYQSEARGINNFGVIVGDYYVNGTDRRGYIYDGNSIEFFHHPDADNYTILHGISDNGNLVGQFDANGKSHAFIAYSSANISKPHIFTAGNPAVASEVNENFDILYEAINTLKLKVELQQLEIEALKNP